MNATRSVAAARGMYGLALLARPSCVAGLLGAPVNGRHPVLRVLGLRQALEALALMARPTKDVVAAAVVVDATHVLSCLGLAAVNRERRRPSLRDATVASAVLAATWLVRPAARPSGPRPNNDLVTVTLDPPRAAHLTIAVPDTVDASDPAARGAVRMLLLPPGRSLLIGRGHGVDLRLGDPLLSPRHVRIDTDEAGTTTVTDLGTMNGTCVNGVPVLSRDLQPGDRIDIGGYTLTYHRTARRVEEARASATAGSDGADDAAFGRWLRPV